MDKYLEGIEGPVVGHGTGELLVATARYLLNQLNMRS
jgi:hypothetical protein